jgi:hypothetical protein
MEMSPGEWASQSAHRRQGQAAVTQGKGERSFVTRLTEGFAQEEKFA